VLTDPELVPFEPPAKSFGLTGLPTLWRNYVETIPRAAYEQSITRAASRFSDVILACDPGLIQEILVEKADAFARDDATRRAFAPAIGESSLFLAEGADWRWQRRAVASIFRHETLLSFIPIFATAAERQVERWRPLQHGATVDAAEAMTRTTFDIIVAAMLGGAATLDAERYGRALNENFDAIPWHIVYDLFSLPRWVPYPGRGRAERARDFLHRDIARIVAARRARPSPKPDLLDLLLAARDPEGGRSMTDMEVVTNLLTFITAGHETTAVALTWSLWLLAKDAFAQQRVRDEAVAVAGAGPVVAAHIEGLAFTRQVLEEAMRLFPPVPGISREPKEAMQLRGMQLTRRSRIHIPIYALHRNLRLWNDPNAFDPGRFAPDRVKARPRYAYMPFGGGPRVCIGASFAMIEATVILATLVRAIRFQPVARYQPRTVTRLTLRPAGGLPLRVEPR
jgi:cytochrome P450